MELKIKTFDSESLFGYKQITTFFQDFSIADNFGLEAVKDTYKRAFESWKTDYKYLTELVMVLNWKIWEHYETNPELATVYDELWTTASDWCMDNLEGEALDYYLATTD